MGEAGKLMERANGIETGGKMMLGFGLAACITLVGIPLGIALILGSIGMLYWAVELKKEAVREAAKMKERT